MDSDDIRRDLSHVNEFIDVFPADRLPRHPIRKPTLLVANTDRSDKPGQHWVAMYIDGEGYGELFDSLASRSRKTFVDFMNRNCTRWITNDMQLQSAVSRFCGHYCVMYGILRSRGFDIERITSYFTQDTGLNDFIAHAFVCRGKINVV